MRKIAIFIILILVFIILGLIIYIFKNNNFALHSEYVGVMALNERKIDVRDEHKYKILVYYPDTGYLGLNKEIEKQINNYIDEFKNDIAGINAQLNQYYTLTITYDSYGYKNYLSYVFHIEYYTGGAHPNHDIWTITYDMNQGKIITLWDLMEKNREILKIFSSLSRNQLLHNKRIVDTSMMMVGTEPIQENFSRFAFSGEGILLFFPQYQVAPYSSGEFIVRIPYDKIF